MNTFEAFRSPERVRALLSEIAGLAARVAPDPDGRIRLMEICGGHTHSIFRYGLDTLLPETIELIHGPGCPVCVLPMQRVDEAVQIAETPGVIFTTFGDAVRVPGTRRSLQQSKAGGADIRILYSPLDAVKLARDNPDREVVFFGLGFETTTPATALTILQARRMGLRNFSVFCNHIMVPPPIRALLEDPHLALDGFIGPGHVSMVTGVHIYDFIAETYRKPIVVAGFEPVDILQSILMLLRQIDERRAEVENQYSRVVPEHGNPASLAAIAQVYEPRPSFEWRGLGEIDASGLRIREEFAAFDAERKFAVGYASADRTGPGPEETLCGDVMVGRKKPAACPFFGAECTPQVPLGALMVSSEGACAAHYRYRGAP